MLQWYTSSASKITSTDMAWNVLTEVNSKLSLFPKSNVCWIRYKLQHVAKRIGQPIITRAHGLSGLWNLSCLCGTWARLYNLKSSLPSDHRKISNRFLVQCKEYTGLWPPLRQASSYCCSLMLHWGLPKTHHYGAQWFHTHHGVACKECWFHLPINHVIVEDKRGTKTQTWRAEN